MRIALLIAVIVYIACILAIVALVARCKALENDLSQHEADALKMSSKIGEQNQIIADYESRVVTLTEKRPECAKTNVWFMKFQDSGKQYVGEVDDKIVLQVLRPLNKVK